MEAIFDLFFGILTKTIELFIDLTIKGIDKLLSKKNSHFNADAISRDTDLSCGKKTSEYDDLGHAVKSQRSIKLNELNTKRHTLIAGASGSGKTSLITILQEEKIKNGEAVIFIDPKGDREALETFRGLCELYNRKCYIFSEYYEGKSSVNLNPIREGSASQIANRIHRAFDWSEEYYKDKAYEALLLAIKKIQEEERQVSFDLIEKCLDSLIKSKKIKKEEISGLLTKISNITHSDFEKRLNNVGSKSVSSIREEKACLYIGLSVLGYAETARSLGKIILGDLNYNTYTTLRDNSQEALLNLSPLNLYIDELGAIIMDDLIELINKCRGAKIEVTVAFQSPSDIDKVSSDLTKQIMENTANWFFLKQSINSASDFFSGSIGTVESIKDTVAVENNELQGRGSRREVESFLVHPTIFKRLRTGQCIFVQYMPFGLELINLRYLSIQKINQELESKKVLDAEIKALEEAII